MTTPWMERSDLPERELNRVVSIVPAAPGWWAIYDEHDSRDPVAAWALDQGGLVYGLVSNGTGYLDHADNTAAYVYEPWLTNSR